MQNFAAPFSQIMKNYVQFDKFVEIGSNNRNFEK